MSHSMLTISKTRTEDNRVHVNLLPCRIHHDGAIDTVTPYWSPSGSSGGIKTAYVRGRKLHGKTVKLPDGYHGSVVEKGETKQEVPGAEEGEGDVEFADLPEAIEIAPLSSKATFDDFVIWGHESTADSGADPYLRSIEEWVSLAEKCHSYSSAGSQGE
ncbi:hypothetical protein TruAng_002103 [Truncatella angustata]|nr:hypothetical protein TruAng_002103 [Truncatella angustata]